MNGWLVVLGVSLTALSLLTWIRAARWTADPKRPYQPRNTGDEE